MKRHIRIFHEKMKSFECQVCEATFGTRSKLQNHNKSIHQKSVINVNDQNAETIFINC